MVWQSPNGVDATVFLDGSRSSDPDGDPLQYLWLLVAPKLSEGGSTLDSQLSTLLATGVVSVAVLPLGAHTIQLIVNDGTLSATNSVTIDVITTAQAVERLASIVHSEVPKPQALLATLRAALASTARNNRDSAIHQLRAFQNKVRAEVAPHDSTLAASLIQFAQQIIQAIGNGAARHAGHLSLVRQPQGSVQLGFSGESAGTYIVEASTNLVNWDRIGVASSTNGQFQFEDARGSRDARRFYRVVHELRGPHLAAARQHEIPSASKARSQ